MAIASDLTSNLAPDQQLTTHQFTVQADAALFSVLTQKVYTDLISAPIREWSTNAVDACKSAGVPIEFTVHIPTPTEPFFSVRDYGTGLPQSDIIGLFTVAGMSTKRESNEFNGTFGIGRLSGLAYSDSFTVDSYYDGSHYSYLISMQEGIPVAVFLASSPTTEPNGLCLSLPVKPSDISSFSEKAESIYRYFTYRPTTNVDLLYRSRDLFYISDEFSIDTTLGQYSNYVLMGDVLYHLKSDRAIDERGFRRLIINCPIGSIAINPGRESLSYTPATIGYLNGAFKRAYDSLVSTARTAISSAPTYIDQLRTFATIQASMPYSISETFKHTISLPNFPVTTATLDNRSRVTTATLGITVKYFCRGGRSRNLANTYMGLKDFSNATFMIVDQAGGSQEAANSVNGYVVQLSRPSGMKMPDFIDLAKLVLADWGVSDYQLVSNLAAATVRNTAAPRIEGIYVCTTAVGDGFSSGTRLQKPIDLVYVELSGSTAIDPDYTGLRLAYEHIRGDKPKLVGIQKKYLSDVVQLSNFTPLRDYLITYYGNHHLAVLDNEYHECSWRHLAVPSYAPPSYLIALSELEQRTVLRNSWFATKQTFDKFSDCVKFNFTEYKFTTPLATMYKSYPLLKHLQSNYYDEGISHYMKLEAYRERTACSP